MDTVKRLLPAGLLLLGLGVALRAEEPSKGSREKEKKKTITRADLNKVRAAARDLTVAVGFLQDVIVEEVVGDKERALFNQADQALGAIGLFRASLDKPPDEEMTRERLAENFDHMDDEVHELLGSLGAEKVRSPSLRPAAERVEDADERLHTVLFGRSRDRKRQVEALRREARSLDNAARRLQRAADYALEGVVLTELQVPLKKLTTEAEAFRQEVKSEADREELRKDFARVNEAWSEVIQRLRFVPPSRTIYVLGLAERFDDVHEQLFERLDVRGPRPKLTVGT